MADVEILQADLSPRMFDHIMAAGMVAWDIETSGLDWREAEIATCQIDAPPVGTIVVKDLDSKPDLLMEVLRSDRVGKVFHHAPFDLRFMRYRWGVNAENVWCTKVASKLLAPDVANEWHSLQPLLRKHLAVEISKDQRTSNWFASELTHDQVRYAVDDVRYLVLLLEALKADLGQCGLEELYLECCRFLPARVELDLRSSVDVFSY